MEALDGKRSKSESLEVTGISRSGRVRKKSSKLMDFESPDEVENKYKRKADVVVKNDKQRKSPMKPIKVQPDEDDIEGNMYERSNYGNNSRESESEGEAYKPEDDDEHFEEDDDVNDDDDDDDDDDFHDGNLVVDEKAPTQSLYMMEKSKKKMVMKDGRAVAAARPYRKDKGKSRFTAYMMWAREIRKALLRKHPDTNISMTASRLSEMWATVPIAERDHWKRRAKRERLVKARAAKSGAPLMPSRKFINKKGGPIAPLHVSTPVIVPKPSAVVDSPPKIKKIDTATNSLATVGFSKFTGHTPLDVAAHLKLLGESLEIIGERLKEHEGQITVSGSLSVLLDSLVCAMGPLLCLTMQIDKMQPDPEVMTKIMHNIEFLMPGLA